MFRKLFFLSVISFAVWFSGCSPAAAPETPAPTSTRPSATAPPPMMSESQDKQREALIADYALEMLALFY